MLKKLIRCNTQVATANMSKKNMYVGRVNNKTLHAEYYVIEGVTHMIRGGVMNGWQYGNKVFDKLADHLMTSNIRVPAPMSHPSDENGNFVDANDPITFPAHNVGAFDTDWRVSGDKLVSNTYVPVDTIDNPKAGNEWFSDKVNNSLPIDRSTGLFLNIDDSITGFGADGEPFNGDVTEIFELNHSAILNPDIEPGAKNNTEGCGMFCNVKGDQAEIEEFDLLVNASTPAMQLPLAPDNYAWSMSKAIVNIREFTGSNEAPSSNYRKFFLEFDQDDVNNFEAYKYPFADIIDGKPHAVRMPVTSMKDTSEHAMTYFDRFEADGDQTGLMNKIWSGIKSIFTNELSHSDIHEKLYKKLNEHRQPDQESFYPYDVYDTYFVYRGDNDKLYKQGYTLTDEVIYFNDMATEVKRTTEYTQVFNNKSESIMDKAKLIALLAANGITANAEMSDADLEAALNTALSDKPAETVVDTATNDQIVALTATVNSLAATVLATSNKELDTSVAAVVALNKGIDEATAKTMGLASCNAFLAANGQSAFSVNSGQHQAPAKSDCASLEMTEQEL